MGVVFLLFFFAPRWSLQSMSIILLVWWLVSKLVFKFYSCSCKLLRMLNLIKHTEFTDLLIWPWFCVCICGVCWTEIAVLGNPHRNTAHRKSVENVDHCYSSFQKEVLNIFSYISWVILIPASRVLIWNDVVLLLWAIWSFKLIREIFTPSAPKSTIIISRAMHLLYVLVHGYSAWKTNGYWFLQCNLHFPCKFQFT